MTEPNMTLEQAQKAVSQKTAPRVTKGYIDSRIAGAIYHVVGTLTICVITMKNGFNVIGTAAPASEANFDPEVGQRYAYEDAYRSLWKLEGYLLRERLAAEEGSAPPVDKVPDQQKPVAADQKSGG